VSCVKADVCALGVHWVLGDCWLRLPVPCCVSKPTRVHLGFIGIWGIVGLDSLCRVVCQSRRVCTWKRSYLIAVILRIDPARLVLSGRASNSGGLRVFSGELAAPDSSGIVPVFVICTYILHRYFTYIGSFFLRTNSPCQPFILNCFIYHMDTFHRHFPHLDSFPFFIFTRRTLSTLSCIALPTNVLFRMFWISGDVGPHLPFSITSFSFFLVYCFYLYFALVPQSKFFLPCNLHRSPEM